MRFWKGHGLGNDYLVAEGTEMSPRLVRAICDRHRGAGSDGILVGDRASDPPGLRIFNPDGTEAEKSGNGLRIFGAWLHLMGDAGDAPFRVRLPGETVEMRVVGDAGDGFLRLRVEMGRASFRAGDAGYTAADPDVELTGTEVEVAGTPVALHPVSLGNRHCVVFPETFDLNELRRLGPAIQRLPGFPDSVNVQLARVAGPGVLDALIWERGADHTLASGSSACAVVAAARRSGRVEGESFVVRMEGGEVEVELSREWEIRLTGDAGIVYEGHVREEVVAGWERGSATS
ncbi:MAG TPA: diaminopimelate epimerase [Longimicrobiales bacterium]|nr:diaminopimelate epimerase [Longimicrobiales bacterium]